MRKIYKALSEGRNLIKLIDGKYRISSLDIILPHTVLSDYHLFLSLLQISEVNPDDFKCLMKYLRSYQHSHKYFDNKWQASLLYNLVAY